MVKKKKCSKCKRNKPLSSFTKRKESKDGFCARCQACTRAVSKKHYAENTSVYIAKAKARNESMAVRLQEISLEEKSKPCTECGKSFPPVAMDFHHKDGDKEYDVSNMVTRGYSEETFRREIAKCIVLCACCHRVVDHSLLTLLKE